MRLNFVALTKIFKNELFPFLIYLIKNLAVDNTQYKALCRANEIVTYYRFHNKHDNFNKKNKDLICNSIHASW